MWSADHEVVTMSRNIVTKGPFKQFQHLLQLAFNTLLNQMFGAFEQVVQHR